LLFWFHFFDIFFAPDFFLHWIFFCFAKKKALGWGKAPDPSKKKSFVSLAACRETGWQASKKRSKKLIQFLLLRTDFI
jgi:hypothetical protein